STTVTIPVGRHVAPLALFDDAHRAGWKLVTAPANGPGAVVAGGGQLRLSYDFGSGERAAYAANQLELGDPLALACAVDGDGGGEALRATLVDRYGERAIVTFARSVDFSATRRLSLAVPIALAPPIAIRNLYAVGTLANPPVTGAGTLTIHDCTGTFPGAQPVPVRNALHPQPARNNAIPTTSAHVGGADAIDSAG
ncbi:MAG TPA: hypothetical protein VHT05_08830, partial [Candidatus Elarobacter sp.]|nr:hypothetical protein [Candidatus Elarobacter sp.]